MAENFSGVVGRIVETAGAFEDRGEGEADESGGWENQEESEGGEFAGELPPAQCGRDVGEVVGGGEKDFWGSDKEDSGSEPCEGEEGFRFKIAAKGGAGDLAAGGEGDNENGGDDGEGVEGVFVDLREGAVPLDLDDEGGKAGDETEEEIGGVSGG